MHVVNVTYRQGACNGLAGTAHPRVITFSITPDGLPVLGAIANNMVMPSLYL